jgi:hypothetical protein
MATATVEASLGAWGAVSYGARENKLISWLRHQLNRPQPTGGPRDQDLVLTATAEDLKEIGVLVGHRLEHVEGARGATQYITKLSQIARNSPSFCRDGELQVISAVLQVNLPETPPGKLGCSGELA